MANARLNGSDKIDLKSESDSDWDIENYSFNDEYESEEDTIETNRSDDDENDGNILKMSRI